MEKGAEKPEAGRSKESLIGIWVGKQIKAEIETWAVEETERTGIELNANSLAKEIFLWAWPQYKLAGSLAALKRVKLLFPRQREKKEQFEDVFFPEGQPGLPVPSSHLPGGTVSVQNNKDAPIAAPEVAVDQIESGNATQKQTRRRPAERKHAAGRNAKRP